MTKRQSKPCVVFDLYMPWTIGRC